MRRLFTAEESGLTRSQLRWGEERGRWRRLSRSVYGTGPDQPTELDRARAHALAFGAALAQVAGVLHRFDAVRLGEVPLRRRVLPDARIVTVHGVPCADAVQALIDLAPLLDDDRWEQALESALRKRLVTIADLAALPRLPARIRRVLARRPKGAPPTESLMETIGLQLARGVPGLGEATRQHEVFTADGTFVARLDLTFLPVGLFFELDGQQHAGQPVYDARRETAVVAATGMLPGRFTWYELTAIPRATQRRMAELAVQAERRWKPAA